MALLVDQVQQTAFRKRVKTRGMVENDSLMPDKNAVTNRRKS